MNVHNFWALAFLLAESLWGCAACFFLQYDTSTSTNYLFSHYNLWFSDGRQPGEWCSFDRRNGGNVHRFVFMFMFNRDDGSPGDGVRTSGIRHCACAAGNTAYDQHIPWSKTYSIFKIRPVAVLPCARFEIWRVCIGASMSNSSSATTIASAFWELNEFSSRVITIVLIPVREHMYLSAKLSISLLLAACLPDRSTLLSGR